MKKLLFATSIFSIVGLFFISLLVHEGVHLYQFKDLTYSQSVCYDFNSNSIMHTTGNLRSYDEANIEGLKGYREKVAYIIQYIFYGLSVLLVGFLIGRRKNKC